MTVDALDAIRKLSLDEHIRLVEQIWDSVADDPDAAVLREIESAPPGVRGRRWGSTKRSPTR